jgi:hypothetical protein
MPIQNNIIWFKVSSKTEELVDVTSFGSVQPELFGGLISYEATVMAFFRDSQLPTGSIYLQLQDGGAFYEGLWIIKNIEVLASVNNIPTIELNLISQGQINTHPDRLKPTKKKEVLDGRILRTTEDRTFRNLDI